VGAGRSRSSARRERSRSASATTGLPTLRFPLADWIDAHSDAPYHLGASGMRGELRTTERLLSGPPPATELEVRTLLGELHGRSAAEVFLTHGATEANGLALLTLHRQLRRRLGRRPRSYVRFPEYPPLWEAAKFAGFIVGDRPGSGDLVVLSNPNNPTSELRPLGDLDGERPRRSAVLVDETFRGFSTARSWAEADERGVWVTGTLTKAFGADEVRLGFAIPPDESREEFGRVLGLLLDGIPSASLAAAAALLRHQGRILRETRGIFGRNLRALRARVRSAPTLHGPLWFDRVRAGLDSERFARAALERGVLVSPGTYFGDPHGVRVGLTRRTFPRDLEEYLRARQEFLDRASDRRGASS
jgi:histidinol-phosphate/aromatic aminotransferase/cobyric acid decarboxylase-like protein